MNVANEIHLLWMAVTLALALIGSLGFQVAHLLKRIRALEEPVITVNSCSAHGYVLPCPICDFKDLRSGGTVTWSNVRKAAG